MTDGAGCRLCGRPTGDEAAGDGEAFCSSGCRTVHEELGPPADGADPAGASDRAGDDPADEEQPPGTTTTFLRVDGMHGPTCEAFLEGVATDTDGVEEAEASYVTETVRVRHDPDAVDAGALAAALTTVGYEATVREGPDEDLATDERIPAERGMDDALGIRYVVGVVFGSFMLLPYVVLVYPAYLAALVEGGALAMFRGRFIFDSAIGGQVFIPFLIIAGVVVAFTGAPVLRGAYVSLRTRRVTTDLLVATALLAAFAYSGAAIVLARPDVYLDLTVVVGAVVAAAIAYESLAKRRALDRLTDLTVSRVAEARLYHGEGATETVAVDDLSGGDHVLVREGERVPVDGTLLGEACTVDEAVVTGESLPVAKREGDRLVGGSVVAEGAAVLRVAAGATSSIDRLTASVRDVGSATHGAQRRADRLAGYALPVVAGVAVVAAGVAMVTEGAVAAVLALLGALLAASPWVLGVATPLSVARSIAAAGERGVVVLDETVFERLRSTDVVVLDKTGTLTTGEMRVRDADVPADLLGAAAALERRSAHPAATAIVEAVEDGVATDGGLEGETADATPDRVAEFRSHATGVEGLVDGTPVLVGAPALFERRNWTVGDGVAARAETAREDGHLPVVVGRDGRAEGVVVVGDEPRDGWAATVRSLADRGVSVVVLTGDRGPAAAAFGDADGVDRVFAGVPPAGKTATVRRLREDGHVTMVGDGTNDAPALAAADLGVALGGGTALAATAADLAVLDDDLAAVATAFDIATAAGRRLRQNTVLALSYNAVAVPLALTGGLNPLSAMAAVAVGVGLVGLNARRSLL